MPYQSKSTDATWFWPLAMTVPTLSVRTTGMPASSPRLAARVAPASVEENMLMPSTPWLTSDSMFAISFSGSYSVFRTTTSLPSASAA